MEAERISEGGSIKVSSAVGRIREMQCITDVEAKDEHVHVVTKTNPNAHRDVVEEIFPFLRTFSLKLAP